MAIPDRLHKSPKTSQPGTRLIGFQYSSDKRLTRLGCGGRVVAKIVQGRLEPARYREVIAVKKNLMFGAVIIY
jgi:hypothetical protein